LLPAGKPTPAEWAPARIFFYQACDKKSETPNIGLKTKAMILPCVLQLRMAARVLLFARMQFKRKEPQKNRFLPLKDIRFIVSFYEVLQ
jgi:hypothetical protein